MTDTTITAEQQGFLDSIAEHIAAIHVASREFIASRKTTNDPGTGRGAGCLPGGHGTDLRDVRLRE